MLAESTTTQTVEEFVRNNKVPTKDGGCCCIDGRYRKGSTNGTRARPGAHFGLVMPLLAVNQSQDLGLTPEECVDKVVSAVTEDGSKFCMHTDHHAPFPNEKGAAERIGCAHIAKAMDPTTHDDYGVSIKDVQKALEHAEFLIKSGSTVQLDSLVGEHEERGVLVVTGTEMTVDHSDGKSMYFVYDQTRDDQFMRALVAKMNIPGLSVEEFIEAANRQLAATIKNLASGVPKFTINADSEIKVERA